MIFLLSANGVINDLLINAFRKTNIKKMWVLKKKKKKENVGSCSMDNQNSHGHVSILKSAAAGVGKTNAPREQENPQKDRGICIMLSSYAPPCKH